LPSGTAGDSLPKGPLDILVEGQPMQAIVAKIAINAVRAPGGENELASILRKWFGDLAGSPGRGERVRFRRDGSTIVMEPFCPEAAPGRKIVEIAG